MRPRRFLPLAVAGLLYTTTAAFAQSGRFDSPLFNQVDLKSDVVFHTATNIKGEAEALKLDIYKPAGDQERKRPAIVWFHGGGFRPGNDKKQRYIVAMANAFAQRGYVCLSADYRTRADPGIDRLPTIRDAVEDGRAAIAWARAHANELGIDPQRIAVGGGSAGGMLAANLVGLENSAAAKSRSPRLFAFINLWGSPREDHFYAKVDEHYPPTVIVHGTADQSVPFAQSEALVAKLKAKGIRHELMAIPGAPHTPADHMDAIVKSTAAFVAAALR